MELKIAGEADKGLWDDLVDKSPQATLFHRWEYLKIMERYSATKLIPIIGMAGDDAIGIYPLFYRKAPFLKMVFSPPPRLAVFYLGPALADQRISKKKRKTALFAEFQEKVDEYIEKELKADYVNIQTAPGLDCRPFKWDGYRIDAIYNYSIDLGVGIDCLWDNLESSMRNNIKKAGSEGITVKEGSRAELEAIYELMNVRYEKQGKIDTVPKDYLLEVYDAFSSNITVMAARHQGKVISGVIEIDFKDKHIGWIGNPKTKHTKVSPSSLLLWEDLSAAYAKGYRRFDVLGAAGIKRLASYYDGLNPELVISFAATKYLSGRAKAMEQVYLKSLKPALAKIKIMARSR